MVEITTIRATKATVEKLWTYIGQEQNRSLEDVIKFLIQIEQETRKLRQDLQAQERNQIGLEMLETQV